MATIKPLTKDDLKAVIKELGVVTKKDLEELGVVTKQDLKELGVVTKKDLEELGVVTKQDLKELGVVTKKDLKELGVVTKKDLDESLLHLERRLKLRMGKHRTEIFAMFGRLATSTPSRREFEELKTHSGRFIAHS